MRTPERREAREGAGARPEAGFSLLGVLVASFIVVVLLGGIVGLSSRAGELTQLARDTHVATFLAREGIELVRSLRDDNWLASPRCVTAIFPCPLRWRGNPAGSLSEQRRAICNTARIAPSNWTIDPLSCPGSCAGEDGPQLLAAAGDPESPRDGVGQLYRTPDGFFTLARGGNVATPYRRVIVITTPGSSEDCGASGSLYDAATTTPPARVLVESVVRWEDRSGRTRSVRLAEELYPWVHAR